MPTSRAAAQAPSRAAPRRAASQKSQPRGKKGAAGREPERVRALLQALDGLYPDADCELRYEGPLQLLVAVILSAQCTDERVNQVTPALFRRYPDAAALAAADPEELEALVRPTGFYRMKAKHIREACRILVEEHGGQVPRTMEALLRLPGVARKTANVVLGTAFGIPSGVVVDTHVRRLSQRLGLSAEAEPEKIERDLVAKLPEERWIAAGHQLILHGRRVCLARKPRCEACGLRELCPRVGVP